MILTHSIKYFEINLQFNSVICHFSNNSRLVKNYTDSMSYINIPACSPLYYTGCTWGKYIWTCRWICW